MQKQTHSTHSLWAIIGYTTSFIECTC